MAQSNHSVEIEVTAQTAQAKKDLQEIEKMLNRLSQGAKVGLGAGGGGRGGSGGGGSGGGSEQQQFMRSLRMRSGMMREEIKQKEKGVKEESNLNLRRLRMQSGMMREEMKQRENNFRLAQKLLDESDRKEAKAYEKKQKEKEKAEKAAAKERARIARESAKEVIRIEREADRAQKRAEREKQREEARDQREKKREKLRLAREMEQDAIREKKKADKEEAQRQQQLAQEQAQYFKEQERVERRRKLRNRALLAGGAYLGYRGVSTAAKTGIAMGSSTAVEESFSRLLEGVSKMPGGEYIAGFGNAMLQGLRTRTELQRNAAQYEPSIAMVNELTGMGRPTMVGTARQMASQFGIGPQRTFQQLALTSARSGRALDAGRLEGLTRRGLAEEALGGDAQSALAFIRSATLSRGAGGVSRAFSQMGRIESFRQAQGLLPAESSMLRQAGMAFRQQGLAQGFDIPESSLFGLTQGLMGRGRSLTGAMGLAQRERQLGFGAFQDFAGQFADLPNTLLLARAAQKGGGISGIFKELSRLGGTPGASARELSGAVSQFNIPRELIQAGVASRLGLGFGAAGDVLGAKAGTLRVAEGVPEISGLLRSENLNLSRAFAKGEVGSLEAGLGFAGQKSAETLSNLLQTNNQMRENLSRLTEGQAPTIIESMRVINDVLSTGVEKMNQNLVVILEVMKRFAGP